MLAKVYDFEKFGPQKILNYPNAKLLQSRLKELGKKKTESKSKNKQITMLKAQFQQTKSTKAVHVRLSYGIGSSTLLSQYRLDSRS